MISVNLSANCGATGCHITCVDENPCSNNSGGPLPPTRAKMRPDEVLIHSEAYPGNRSARSGMGAPCCFKLCLPLPPRKRRFMPFLKPDQQEQEPRKPSDVDRFRNPGRSQGDPRKSPPMGARRMHS